MLLSKEEQKQFVKESHYTIQVSNYTSRKQVRKQ